MIQSMTDTVKTSAAGLPSADAPESPTPAPFSGRGPDLVPDQIGTYRVAPSQQVLDDADALNAQLRVDKLYADAGDKMYTPSMRSLDQFVVDGQGTIPSHNNGLVDTVTTAEPLPFLPHAKFDLPGGLTFDGHVATITDAHDGGNGLNSKGLDNVGVNITVGGKF